MIEYKYKKRENKFTENGHTMFETDVLQRLKRLADIEDRIKQGQLLPIDSVVGSSCTEDIYVSHGNNGDDDVYCAFTDHARGLKDCEECGTLLTHIKLYRGAK